MYGYYGDLYCPNCQEMFDFIFVEFEKRYPEFLSAWKEIIMREMDEDVVRCPRCGLRNLELV
jgi:DNA-directed RNA polymerase subunit RPC12/RpoP